MTLAKPINDIPKESLLEIVENDTAEGIRKSKFQLPEITDNGHSRANATITTLTDENNHSRPESRMISTDMDKRPVTIEMTYKQTSDRRRSQLSNNATGNASAISEVG